MEKPELTIEFGLRDACGKFEGLRHFPAVLEKMTQIRKQFESEVDLRLIPFERPLEALLRGGRDAGLSSWNIEGYCRHFNHNGYSFMVPLNGGLTTTPAYVPINFDGRIFDADREVLSTLAKNSSESGIPNYVTVTRDDVRNYIRERFPELKIVASCVKFVGGHKEVFKGEKEYDDAFEGYDYVVPLSQHSTPDFLGRYRSHVKKMVLLALTECNGPVSRECFNHYVRSQCAFFNFRHNPSREFSGDFSCINVPSFPEIGSGCAPNLSRSLLGARVIDLMDLVKLGVDKFKIPAGIRVDTLDVHNIARLVDIFLKNRAEAPAVVESDRTEF